MAREGVSVPRKGKETYQRCLLRRKKTKKKGRGVILVDLVPAAGMVLMDLGRMDLALVGAVLMVLDPKAPAPMTLGRMDLALMGEVPTGKDRMGRLCLPSSWRKRMNCLAFSCALAIIFCTVWGRGKRDRTGFCAFLQIIVPSPRRS